MLRPPEALFMGSHTNKIDAKGRIATPADFRKVLDTDTFNGFVCVPSLIGPDLDCGGFDLLARLQSEIEEMDRDDPDREATEIAIMGRARRLSFDKDGRIILPKAFIEHANLDGQASFVGRGDFFQISKIDDVEDRFKQAEKRARERRARKRAAIEREAK